MKIQTRIFLGFLVIIGIGFAFLLSWVLGDLEPQYRKVTEEPLVDTSRVLASFASTTAVDGKINVDMFRDVFEDAYSRPFSAEIDAHTSYGSDIYGFRKEDVDYRVYITDSAGVVIFDSNDGKAVGEDYSQWRDVYLTLRSKYGARTSHEDPLEPEASIMYVASPIMSGSNILGVLSVGKPTKNVNSFVESSKTRIMVAGLVIFLSVIIVGMFISRMVTRPVQKLTEYARKVRDGERTALPSLGRGEIYDLGVSFEEMRDALEGKHYVEKYVQALTHEIKSPVSAIQGAVELLQEDLPSEQRARFLNNIHGEAERINTVVEKLLLLSSLESKREPPEKNRINLYDTVTEVIESMHPLFEAKHLSVDISGDGKCFIEGELFLVRHAIVNVLQNAVNFSPSGKTITVSLIHDSGGRVTLSVADEGPGIPDYALNRVYERFYSLKRPDTGKRSSGLGLSLVKEVAHHHEGSFILKNSPGGGARAVLIFPAAPRAAGQT